MPKLVAYSSILNFTLQVNGHVKQSKRAIRYVQRIYSLFAGERTQFVGKHVIVTASHTATISTTMTAIVPTLL